jgi:hypothetical protein
MVAVQNTEDVHGKRPLFFHPSRDVVFGRESYIDKLFFPLVVNIAGGRRTEYPSHLFLDVSIHTASGKQAKILTEAPPVFIVGLEKLLTGSIVYPIKKSHIDCLVLREKMIDIFHI